MSLGRLSCNVDIIVALMTRRVSRLYDRRFDRGEGGGSRGERVRLRVPVHLDRSKLACLNPRHGGLPAMICSYTVDYVGWSVYLFMRTSE